MSGHLAPFALWTAFPSSLAGRYSCDYYGHCVTNAAHGSWIKALAWVFVC
jgi:hypothetical protein